MIGRTDDARPYGRWRGLRCTLLVAGTRRGCRRSRVARAAAFTVAAGFTVAVCGGFRRSAAIAAAAIRLLAASAIGGYGGYYGGYGFGDALLGAAVIGSTAAIIASNQPDYYDLSGVRSTATPRPSTPRRSIRPPRRAMAMRRRRPDRRPRRQPQQQAYQSTDPVDQCSRAAVSEAASRGDNGRVTKIDRVDSHANGARVIGTLEVRRDSHNGEVENARFTCTADFGQVTSFRFG